MEYLKVSVILFMLLNGLHKALPQEEETTTPPAAPPAANGAPSMMAAPSPGQQATTAATSAATPSPDSGLQAIAAYLNQKIGQELAFNPALTEGSLASVFNAERSKLENARITGTATDDAISQAEQALRSFETFVLKYKPLANMLQNALDDLDSINENMRLPLEFRYMALMLQSKLAGSTSLSEAERTLKQYAEFKKGQDSGNNGFSPGAAPSTFPPLNDEYRKYFEEIIQILRKNLPMGSPQMTNILQQLLNNPQQVKQILKTLKEVAEDIIGDLFEDIFDFA